VKKKVSIIIPVFNAEEFIYQSIASCLNQTYNNLELIVVDDGSTDNTVNILNQLLIDKPDAFKLVKIKNSGPATARKVGLNISSGDYIFFLDADDLISPTCFQVLVESADTNNYDIVVGQYKLKRNESILKISHYRLVKGNSQVIKSFLLQKLPFTLWPVLYKRMVLNDVIFSNEITVGEDFLINCQVFSQPNIRVGVIKEAVYTYRIHNSSITRTLTQEKIQQNFMAYNLGMNIILEKHETKDLKVEICFNMMVYAYSLFSKKSPYLSEFIEKLKLFSAKTLMLAYMKLEFKHMFVISMILIFPSTIKRNKLYYFLNSLKSIV
jgi:glycosyltransferase involved in cell wall biosynthesis